MATYVPPKRATEYIFYVGLEDTANAGLFKASPTLATGDVKVSKDGGALANITTLPTVTPAAGRMVKVTLSSTEMTADNVTVVFNDASGGEWNDLIVNIPTAVNQIDDIASDIATVDTNVDAILVDTGTDGVVVASHTTAAKAEINVEADTAISDAALATATSITTLSSKLLKYFQLLFRKDSAIAADNSTELTAINADGGSGAGAYDNAADSVEAIRDRGDAAWLTATGFSTHSAADVRTEVDSNSTQLAAIVADTNELQTDWADAGRLDAILDARASQSSVDGLNNLSAAEVNAEVDTALAEYDAPTKTELDSGLAALNDPTAATIADAVWDEAASGHTTVGTFGKAAADILDDTGTSGVVVASIATDAVNASALASDAVAEINATVDTAISDAALATAASVAALNDLSASEVNAEVVDALSTDTYAEPSSTPAATASLAAKIGWLMKLARNKMTQNSSTQTLYADDGTTADNTATVSDDGSTFTKGEWS